ncbi:HU family DNA-binding protein [Deinococcus sp. S9]|uniref:HU family DNA-binding protein n=1 Tax=Deinococcus sp. S9 TaxID=2545754 RepID=UPI001054D823|nr:HU family DNA-binding protein [Deinococcus sp. S9]TDE85053.1 HU family DNA-binding protein [Deinococcus sp. S9]
MTKTSTKAPAKKKTAKVEPAPQVEPAETAAPAAGGKIAKAQLVEQVAEKSGLTRKQAGQVVDAAMEAIVASIRRGQSVGLPGLGTLSVKQTAARTGVKPGTTERIQIPAGRKVAFKVASTLKGNLGGNNTEA